MNLDTVVQGRSRVNEGKRISQVTDQIWENHFEVWSDVAINYKGHWFSCRCFIRRGTHDIISHLPAYHNISKEREYVFFLKQGVVSDLNQKRQIINKITKPQLLGPQHQRKTQFRVTPITTQPGQISMMDDNCF